MEDFENGVLSGGVENVRARNEHRRIINIHDISDRDGVPNKIHAAIQTCCELIITATRCVANDQHC